MAKTKNCTYMITLDAPMWPRKIADELSFAHGIHEHLVSVTDLQNDTHIYGATYSVSKDDRQVHQDTYEHEAPTRDGGDAR